MSTNDCVYTRIKNQNIIMNTHISEIEIYIYNISKLIKQSVITAETSIKTIRNIKRTNYDKKFIKRGKSIPTIVQTNYETLINSYTNYIIKYKNIDINHIIKYDILLEFKNKIDIIDKLIYNQNLDNSNILSILEHNKKNIIEILKYKKYIKDEYIIYMKNMNENTENINNSTNDIINNLKQN